MTTMYPAPDPRTAVQPLPQNYQPHPPPAAYAAPVFMQQTTVQAGFNHGPHVVLDLLSCGLWIPMHILFWVLSGAK